MRCEADTDSDLSGAPSCGGAAIQAYDRTPALSASVCQRPFQIQDDILLSSPVPIPSHGALPARVSITLERVTTAVISSRTLMRDMTDTDGDTAFDANANRNVLYAFHIMPSFRSGLYSDLGSVQVWV